jgi:hypothetical protein
MCDAVVPEVKSLNVTSTCNVLAVGSRTTVAKPVPSVVTGGISAAPVRLASNVIVLNDAISIYFADATLASAFLARWCASAKVETASGVFHVREDEPAPRIGAGLHRTP